MSNEAPKEIWVSETEFGERYWQVDHYEPADEYILKSEADARVAAAYDDCWSQSQHVGRFAPDIPADAQAALAARDKRVRAEALREAIEAVSGNMEPLALKAYDVGYNSACTDAEDTILALIEGDQTDDQR